MNQNNQWGRGEKQRFTKRKTFFWSEDDEHRATRLAHRYGGSVSEVLRAGIRALEREHERMVTREKESDDD